MKPSPASTKAPLPWISPLHYRRPTRAAPPSPPPPPPPLPEAPLTQLRYVHHPDLARLIASSPSAQRALDLFNAAAAQRGFSHTPATFAALLVRLARARLPSAAAAVLRRAASAPCRFLEPQFLPLLRLLPPDHSLALLRLLPALLRRGRVSRKALAVCLDRLVSSRRCPDVLTELLADLRDPRSKYLPQPNTCIYNILIKHYVKKGDLGTAFQVFDEMRKMNCADVRPSLVTYSTLIGGLCRGAQMKEAFELFEDMIEKDRIVPDQLTYNLLIGGFCRLGQVEKAQSIFGFMRKNECEPNAFNYATLINGHCKKGEVEAARGVFEEMIRSGVQPDAVSYTSLVGCLCRHGNVDEGINLVQEMWQKGCKADVVTYNLLLEGLCKDRRIAEAVTLLEKLPSEGVQLNVASYRIVMNCLCSCGEMEKAAGLLGMMLGRGFVPHYAASNMLLIGLCDVGRVSDATVTLYGLVDTGFMPEARCWARLIESVFRERKLRRSIELLDVLIAEG
ncbi:pentatricopeptide repeat-containing protein At5g18475-like [Oryza glaberrima]|uniref:pentatricopeptide repeat-containing protein At5g18475-like n=1 Tax=Oryza glaberrima TaxID=4538 RepID=UPI00224BFC0F|nr:pentatricopeptide repeat-containing protein At5g18475-like [Oryza glaberrima]